MTKSQTAEDRNLEALTAKTLAQARNLELQNKALERAEEEHENSDSSHRTYTFYDNVNDDSVKDCISELSYWRRIDPKCKVIIVLNSPGGYCVDGLALYDFLRDMRKAGHHVTIKVYGEASSMGGILLQAGDKREMSKFSYLLIHEVSAGAIGKGSIIKDKAEWVESLWDKLAGILAERSTLTKEEIKERAERRDWIMWAPAAKQLGFCDRVT